MFFSTESSRGRGTPKNAFEALAMLEKELLGVAAGSGSGTGGEGSAAEDEDPDAERRLNVGIIGEPNVGKSSLLNLLVNSPVSAVSPKRNTTRDSIVGIHMSGNTQLVFYDTPGFMQKEVHREFFQPLQNSVVSMCRTVDVILLVIDAARRLDLKMFNVVQGKCKCAFSVGCSAVGFTYSVRQCSLKQHHKKKHDPRSLTSDSLHRFSAASSSSSSPRSRESMRGPACASAGGARAEQSRPCRSKGN